MRVALGGREVGVLLVLMRVFVVLFVRVVVILVLFVVVIVPTGQGFEPGGYDHEQRIVGAVLEDEIECRLLQAVAVHQHHVGFGDSARATSGEALKPCTSAPAGMTALTSASGPATCDARSAMIAVEATTRNVAASPLAPSPSSPLHAMAATAATAARRGSSGAAARRMETSCTGSPN